MMCFKLKAISLLLMCSVTIIAGVPVTNAKSADVNTTSLVFDSPTVESVKLVPKRKYKIEIVTTKEPKNGITSPAVNVDIIKNQSVIRKKI